ncbi:MAG: Fe-S cluster assembly protein SufD [Muribaculaceae bacterium]|nr:Fe-S cluster assembly protein SufD [Muribaculaceae bacterium]
MAAQKEDNALTQYLQLYDTEAAEISARSCPVLEKLRKPALKRLRTAALPHKGTPGYEKTDINAMFAPDYGVNTRRMAWDVDLAASFRCDVPNVSTLLAVVANDIFRPTATLENNLPQGVTVCSLDTAARKYPELVGRYLDSIAAEPRFRHTVATDLNNLLMQDGVFIHVAPGVRPERPIQIVNILNATVPLMAVRRVLVVVEDNAAADILLCDHTARPGTDYLINQVTEVYLGRGASANLYDIQEADAGTSRLAENYIYMPHEGASVAFHSFGLRCGNSRSNIQVVMTAPHCTTDLGGMVICTDEERTDIASRVTHAAPHCDSDQMFKYVVDDDARGAFEGAIVVEHGAHHTRAYQNNRNLLASEKARMHTRPQLEIYCDDVSCSHGAATGQLDARALFYMRSRGIPESQARTMLIQAFMMDVVDKISLDGLNSRMRHLVERRLSGESATCAGCNTENLNCK